MPTPALVYSTEETPRAELDRYLFSKTLYRYDDLPELAEDLTLPPVQRPVLRRLLTYTDRAGTVPDPEEPRSLDHVPLPSHLVVDHLGSLGPDLLSQVAVVGAFMGSDVRVVVDYQELTLHWYHEQARRLDSSQLHTLIGVLADVPPVDVLGSVEPRNPRDLWMLPTSQGPARSYPNACHRIDQLVRTAGMAPTAVAPVIQVAGYRNRHGRVRWYPKAIKDALAGEL